MTGIMTFLRLAVGNVDADAVALESYHFWRQVGYDHDGACAWVANEQGETSFDHQAIGDHGEAFGPAQHHEGRIDNIKDKIGIDIKTASHLDQLKALDWESRNAIGYRHVHDHVMAAVGRRAKVAVLVTEYEQSRKQQRDIDRRTGFADEMAERFKEFA